MGLFSPGLDLLSPLQKEVPQVLGWIAGDVQERDSSCALLSWSPGLRMGTSLLTSLRLQHLL